MANLRYLDKHNMVAFLKKPTESIGFTEIVDFLKGTSLRYALSHNPTIYDSIIKQFWQIATVRTLANGIQELVASVDNKEYTITEASIRSQLQMTDATGIINLSDAKIYEGLATLGSIDRQDTEVPQPQDPTITFVADEATTTSVRVETKGAATTTSGLDAGMDSGNIHESPLRSHEAPLPEGNTSGSAEDSLQLKELMAIVPKMVTKIDSLEKELKETKQTLGHAVLTLVKKVKSLEVALKRMSKRVILSDSEDEETENQGRKIQDIDDDPLVSLVRESMKEKEADFASHTKASASGEAQEEDISPTILEAAQILSQVVSQSVSTYKRRTRSANKGKDIGIGMDFFSAAKERLNSAKVEVNTEVNPGSAGVNTGNTPVSTPSVIQTVNVIVPSLVKSQREGKAPMTSEDVQATQKTKEQIRQEEAGLAEAMRLQALQDEEDARQVHLDALLAKRIQEEQELSEQQQKRKAKLMRSIKSFVPMGSEERVKRAGVQLEQESSKKQKIDVEDVSVIEEKVEVVKKEEPIKRTGKGKSKKLGKCCTKALATPEQTATGKEISNPLTADSLLKTIREDEMLLKIKSQNHNLWDIIVNGDLQEEPAPTGDQSGPSAPPVPKTTKQLATKRNQERVKSILLVAILDEYLLKFHNVPDAKSL
ncbi:hypothetical protein Tco_0561959 [Tanacetum coccineum]